LLEKWFSEFSPEELSVLVGKKSLVLLLDGYDELPNPYPNICKQFEYCININVIITCRRNSRLVKEAITEAPNGDYKAYFSISTRPLTEINIVLFNED